MKKINMLGALLLVLLMAVPMILAEDQNNDTNAQVNVPVIEPVSTKVDGNTLKEISIMDTMHGAEVRLLQLEKSLQRNVLVGRATIEVLTKNHSDNNGLISMAETIVDELDSVISEVKAMELNVDKNELVTQFVAYKKEGISLTKSFRDTVRPILTAADKIEIKETIKDLDKNELNEYNERIRQVGREFSAEKVEALLKLMDTENPELIAKINAGTATPAEITTALRDAYRALTPEQKRLFSSIVKENIIKKTIAGKTMKSEVENKLIERGLNTQGKRLERLSNYYGKKALDANKWGHEAAARKLENLSDLFEKESQRVRARTLIEENELTRRGRR
jgi:hypothetical protein